MQYDAFISYAHEDQRTAEWIGALLRSYWVPWRRRRRIFFDQESLSAEGGLEPRIRAALASSRFLIVCCSRASAESEWVNLEIEEFRKAHAQPAILACFVGPETEQTHPSALELFEKSSTVLLKPDLRGDPSTWIGSHRDARVRAALALLAPLVGLDSKDDLRDRQKRWKAIGALIAGAAMTLALAAALILRSDGYQVHAAIARIESLPQPSDSKTAAQWIVALARAKDPETVLEAAEDLTEPELKSTALSEATPVITALFGVDAGQHALETALQSAGEISYPYTRSEAFLAAFRAAVALRARAEAVAAATKIDLRERRYAPLAELVDGLILLGAEEDARALANKETERALIAIGEQDDRTAQLFIRKALATALAAAGETTRAVDHCALLEVPYYRGECWADVASRLSRTRRIEDARTVVARALEVAPVIKSESYRASLLVELARAAPAEAEAPALESIQRLDDPVHRLATGARLRVALGPAGDAARLDAEEARWVEAALVALATRRDETQGVRGAVSVARSLLRLGRRSQAREVTIGLVELARASFRREVHLDVLLQAVAQMSLADPTLDRVPWLEEAASAYEGIADDAERSQLCARIASAWATEGQLRRARLLAERCEANDDRISALAAVLDASAESKRWFSLESDPPPN